MAAGIRIIARRMMSAAAPWIGALMAARRAPPAAGPDWLMPGVLMRRPNKVRTQPSDFASAMVRSM